jgi:hypothetical protein
MKITQDNIQDVFKCKQKDKENLISKGYKEVREFFVDSSGMGAEDESALTPRQFVVGLSALLKIYPNGIHCFITDVGQFQLYVTAFIKE